MSDIFDIQEEITGDPAIVRMVAAAESLINQERLVSDLEENLSEAKKILQALKTQEIPDLMAECGLSEFKHKETGAKISVGDFVSGSLPKDPDKREAAIQALTDLGAESLIKTEINMAFGKSQHNIAIALFEELKAREMPVEMSLGVHAQTLMAFAREAMANGEEIPLETLGLYAGRVAKVTYPKAKKGK